MTQTKLIQFPDKHSAVFGTTQTGKTYATVRSLQRAKCGVLFFDMKQEPVAGYVTADKHTDAGLIVGALRDGDKVNYTPSRETRYGEVAAVIEYLLDSRVDAYVICDECHLAWMDVDKPKRAAQAAYGELATVGLSQGLKAVYITQRPAIMSNTLMSQSEYKVFFRMEDEGPYLQRYGIPHEELSDLLTAGGDYAYVTRYRGVMNGPYKV